MSQDDRFICLTFSNGKQIFTSKHTLDNISFFRDLLECEVFDDEHITEIPLVGVVDNYNIMEQVINYVTYGSFHEYEDIEQLYELALVDNYLVDVSSDGSCNLTERIMLHKNKFLNKRKYTKKIVDTIYKLDNLYNENSMMLMGDLVKIPDYKETLLYLDNKEYFDNYMR
jgi:hypothetical protein